VNSNYPAGFYGDHGETGQWFEELAEATPGNKCHKCGDTAEWLSDDDEYWCSPCAGEYDDEMRWDDPDDYF